MDSYQILVIALLILAIGDLVVGVSNDAVNFLVSAIGSRVASMRTILIIAALGVFAGAAFSSGMMEVARKGIFNPEFFSFADVMVIFMAVMITDILLLDLFNSLGLPTSTTVSIVFELLGASMMTGFLMLRSRDSEAESLVELINDDKAIEIISGIFLSIAVAFTVGAVVMWLSRLWFTFDLQKRMPKYGAIFGGVAMTLVIYFLLIKGIKGAVFATDEATAIIQNSTWLIILGALVISTLVLFLLQKLANINPLKIVVLAGTFALAMAFAGNDLVNFVGVPIAGFQSFQLWQESGMAADAFMMDSLASKVPAPTLLLFASGAIMVITLWLSAKARRVTATSINLSSQSSVDERFKPNLVSRGIVSAGTAFANFFSYILPENTIKSINRRFTFQHLSEEDKPAFDLIRAAVNLMVASILIAFASSLKLPLSTTYVTFMVAMGTSLADRAWGAGSAPYRVAGVVNVIGGWFLTALGAFTAAAIVALLIFYGGNWVAIGLFVVAVAVLVRSNWPRRGKGVE